MNALGKPTPPAGMSRSAWCRELYLGGVHDRKQLELLTGLSSSSVWHALRNVASYRPSTHEPLEPTVAEYERAYAILTARGSVRDHATEIAKEFARIRCAGGKR